MVGRSSAMESIDRPSDGRQFIGCSPLSDYKLVKILGEGTFGEVHKAVHLASGQMVACKKILMQNEKEGFPVTALREIKILKYLSHENVIELTDMIVKRFDKRSRSRAQVFMVTPYMDHDLSGLIENPDVEFSVPQIKCYMKQLLEGVAYLHSKKVMHRDMKSANLLINNRGILKIADFGLARFFDENPPNADESEFSGAAKRQYTNCVVTRWYRPPELLLGERKYTCAVDMWGIGCIFGEMYRKRPILMGKNDKDQVECIFKLCGSPTEQTMPGWTSLPESDGGRGFGTYVRTLERSYRELGADMVDLFSKLLELDSMRRYSAAAALRHHFFSGKPLPCEPSEIPHYEESHEIDKRRFRANKQAPVEVSAPRAPAGYSISEDERLRVMQSGAGAYPLRPSEQRYNNDFYRFPPDQNGKAPFSHGPYPDFVPSRVGKHNRMPSSGADHKDLNHSTEPFESQTSHRGHYRNRQRMLQAPVSPAPQQPSFPAPVPPLQPHSDSRYPAIQQSKRRSSQTLPQRPVRSSDRSQRRSPSPEPRTAVVSVAIAPVGSYDLRELEERDDRYSLHGRTHREWSDRSPFRNRSGSRTHEENSDLHKYGRQREDRNNYMREHWNGHDRSEKPRRPSIRYDERMPDYDGDTSRGYREHGMHSYKYGQAERRHDFHQTSDPKRDYTGVQRSHSSKRVQRSFDYDNTERGHSINGPGRSLDYNYAQRSRDYNDSERSRGPERGDGYSNRRQLSPLRRDWYMTESSAPSRATEQRWADRGGKDQYGRSQLSYADYESERLYSSEDLQSDWPNNDRYRQHSSVTRD